MSDAINGLSRRIAGVPQQVQSTPQVDDHKDGKIEATEKKKLSKKGIADFNDSFEATPQGLHNPQHNPLQLPAVQQPQKAEQTRTAGLEGSRKSEFHIDMPKNEQIDENGYKWLSWQLASTAKNLNAVQSPFQMDPLQKLGEMWKEEADKAKFSNIRA